MPPTMKSVAARFTSRTYSTGLSPNPRTRRTLQKLPGGGETGGHSSFDLRTRVGIAAEDEGWWTLDVDERLVVGIGRLAVLPAVDRGCLYARSHVVLRLLEEQAGHRGVVASRMLAAELRTGVDGDGGDFGDALLPVVGDPEKRVAPDLDTTRFRHLAGTVEKRHHRDARVVAYAFEGLSRLGGERDAVAVDERQSGRWSEDQGVGGIGQASGGDLPTSFALA